MFKVMLLYIDVGLQSLPPLISDVLLEVRPYLNQTLFQDIDVTYVHLIHPVLKTAPNFVIYWM